MPSHTVVLIQIRIVLFLIQLLVHMHLGRQWKMAKCLTPCCPMWGAPQILAPPVPDLAVVWSEQRMAGLAPCLSLFVTAWTSPGRALALKEYAAGLQGVARAAQVEPAHPRCAAQRLLPALRAYYLGRGIPASPSSCTRGRSPHPSHHLGVAGLSLYFRRPEGGLQPRLSLSGTISGCGCRCLRCCRADLMENQVLGVLWAGRCGAEVAGPVPALRAARLASVSSVSSLR